MAGAEGGPVRTALLAAVIAAAAAFAISASHDFSKERIAANRRARLIASLNSVLDPALRERDLATVRIAVTDKELLGNEPVDVYVPRTATRRSRRCSRPRRPKGITPRSIS